MPKTPSIVLGLSYGHGDSSAALIVKGKLVAAAEEERFSRRKHDAGFPAQAVRYCLDAAKISPRDVECIAIAKNPRAAWWAKMKLAMSQPQLVLKRQSRGEPLLLGKSLRDLELAGARLYRVEHHLAHVWSARYLSDAENIALLSFDGLGDFVSALWAKGSADGVVPLQRTFFPHSVGFFYTALTQFLGFPHFGDEFKVMGLSSYGSSRYLEALREVIRTHENGEFSLNLEAIPVLRKPMELSIQDGSPKVGPIYNANFLTGLLGVAPRRSHEPLLDVHRDLAKSVQARFEEVANHLLKHLYELTQCPTLALAGGCAHNSVWVGKIPRNTPFKEVFVAPASHDAGIAIGAAIAAAQTPVSTEGHWGLLGPDASELASTEEFEAKGLTFTEHKQEGRLVSWMVEELAQGKILGLFQGRMEFGPRALGSRSILADPRVADMKDRLNARVKHREPFRPFAASVLWEDQDQWFSHSFFAPTMEAVFEVKANRRTRIPAVVHADQTCRIQSVTKKEQPFFWRLLKAFKDKTGVPMLINTSFNDSEPIVCTPEDAVRCFLGTEMDALVLGNTVVTRRGAMKKTA